MTMTAQSIARRSRTLMAGVVMTAVLIAAPVVATDAYAAPLPAATAVAPSAVTDGFEVANNGAIASVDLAGTWGFTPVQPGSGTTTIQVPGGGWVKQGWTNLSEAIYSRSITVPDSGQPQTVKLELGAVNHEATLTIDGTTVGSLTTSYTPQSYDLTPYVQPGGTYTIELRIKGRDALVKDGKYLVAEGAEWSSTVPQGIYRSAFLRVYPQTYVASTFVTTSVANKTVSYDVELRNSGAAPQTVTLGGSLASASGGSFTYPAIPATTVTVPAGGAITTTVGPLTWTAGSDSYWWPNVPYVEGYRAQLHELTVSLTNGTAATQTTKTRFGFREFTQPANQNKYFLNGVAVNLRGDNIQVADYDRIDANGTSDAVDFLPGFLPPSAGNGGWPEAVDNYQRLNFNVVRLHQSPVSPYMVDVLDEMGMMAIGESAIRGSANREDFVAGHDNMVNHMRDIVLQNRNHASIIEWSQSNEADQAATDSEQFEMDLFNAIRKVDPTRPIIADGPPPGYYPNMTPENGYTQFNSFEHYADGFGNYGTWMTTNPNYPNGETEYIWPATSTKQGFTWFTTATVGKRGKGAADLRPYTLLSGWAGFVPGTKSTDFITEENRFPIYGEDNLADPWSNPQIQLMQRGFSPYLAADLAYWDQTGRSNDKGEFPVKTAVPPIGYGNTVTRGITVFNDGLVGTSIGFSWEARAESPTGAVIASDSTTLEIPNAGQQTVPVTFISPSSGTAVYLVLKTSVGGVEQFSDSSQYLPLGSASSIDDAEIGAGPRQFAFSGDWTHARSTAGYYAASESTSSAKDATAVATFSGNVASLYAGTGPDRGIVAVSIDGGAEQRVDLYAATSAGDQSVWSSPILASGQHTLKVRVTGDKNASATAATASVDRVDAPTSLTTTVIGAASGRCLDLFRHDGSDGAIIDIYDCDGGRNQSWTLDGDGQLVNVESGKCLDIAGASTQNGARVQQWTCNGGANQKWVYDVQQRLVNPVSGKCITTSDGATGNGSRLLLWTCENAASYKWTLSVPVKPTVPAAPVNVTGVAGNGSVTVSWQAPPSTGGADIVGYEVSSTPASKGCVTSTGWSTYTCTVPQLTNGVAYTFTVKAQNTVGIGPASASSAPVTPVDPSGPSAPVVTAAAAPAPNAAGWSSQPVTVTGSATDSSGKPITLAYRVDGGQYADSGAGVTVSTEGDHEVTVRATGSTGLVSTTSVPLKLDLTAPVSSASSDPASGTVTQGQTVTVRFTASDARSGVARTEYSTDGGATWVRATSAGVSFSAVGTYVVSYRSIDTAGNVEATKQVTATVSAPSSVATATVTSSDTPSADGWYQQSVLVKLTAPAGQKIQYRISGGTWRSYSSSITVSANGITVLDHRLLSSNAVISGSEAQLQVKLDTVAPAPSAVRSPSGATGTPRNPLSVQFAATDAMSGVSSVEYRVNQDSWHRASSAPIDFATPGDYVVSYRATDRAGNVSQTKSVTFTIKSDPVTVIKASASTVTAGTPVTVSLAGFTRWDDVTVALAGTAVATVLTDVNGSARVTFQVPSTTAAGKVSLVATGAGGLTASTTVTVKK